MFNEHRARPARLDSSNSPGMPPRLETSADRERAPITFEWLGIPAHRDRSFWSIVTDDSGRT